MELVAPVFREEAVCMAAIIKHSFPVIWSDNTDQHASGINRADGDQQI